MEIPISKLNTTFGLSLEPKKEYCKCRVSIVEDNIYFDSILTTPSYISKSGLYYYDISRNWSLCLSGPIDKFSLPISSTDNIISSQLLTALGIANPKHKHCDVILEYNGKTSTFHSTIARSLVSMKEFERISILDDIKDFKPISQYSELGNLSALIEDIILLYKNKLDPANAEILYDTQSADENSVLMPTNLYLDTLKVVDDTVHGTKRYQSNFLDIREFALTIFNKLIYNLSSAKQSEFNSKFIEELERYLVEDVVFESPDNVLDDVEYDKTIIISNDVTTRNRNLIEAVEDDDKFLVKALINAKVDINYNNAEAVINSVKNGDDYLLRIIGIDRLKRVMEYKHIATKLLMTSLNAPNLDAFEYIIANDARVGKEKSSAYAAVIKELNTGKYCEARSAYIKFRGPRYAEL